MTPEFPYSFQFLAPPISQTLLPLKISHLCTQGINIKINKPTASPRTEVNRWQVLAAAQRALWTCNWAHWRARHFPQDGTDSMAWAREEGEGGTQRECSCWTQGALQPGGPQACSSLYMLPRPKQGLPRLSDRAAEGGGTGATW